jgi:hypothetical protein
MLHDFFIQRKKIQDFPELVEEFLDIWQNSRHTSSIGIVVKRYSKFFNFHSGNSENSVK